MTEHSGDNGAGRLRITLAQLNPVAGDIPGNLERAREALAAGRAAGADLVMLPEMFLSGYQLLDLSIRPAFLRDCQAALEALAAGMGEGDPALGIGAPMEAGRAGEAEQLGRGVYNAYHLLEGGAGGGRIRARFAKHHRPNYGVFDEKRLYLEGPPQGPVAINGCRVGFPICEDMWFPDVAETLEESGAELFLVPNGSPYDRHKVEARMNHMVARTVETRLSLVYLNLMGGQDDQVFDGGSFGLNPGKPLAFQMPFFEEAIETVEARRTNEGWRLADGPRAAQPEAAEADYRAMVTATRDYVRKAGFSKVLLGLSGGIDSAIVAAIATDALGAENVRCVMMPSRFTSRESLEDAAAVAGRLGVRLDELSIAGAVAALEQGLAPHFEGMARDLTEENIQSRLRGTYLMALSNKFGEMLLTTGNKSEMAVGYATIYGDMNGGYNPIKDLYKTRVFAAARWRNTVRHDWMLGPAGEVIPERVIAKPPSAELREDQKDEDSLPPYEILDAILERLVEEDASTAEIIAEGHDRETVMKVQHLLYISEYKRFQSAPGTKLTRRAFWLDRRYPIVNRWRDRS
ncbi:NAD+ synthase [Paralimibaculum aggregatum]|uniref:Glutamine-dependent NAD(+) synthetase n=1 Tax=Paralimibaculum aggregatum TaxID=3036245 RepID=A0ABQ6LE59_9RHOB|nr:NAD+ synthase [Limibaculum sp. NKW23]GMG81645.1 NAD+ synthase [Limibaculum sp. NKW23]